MQDDQKVKKSLLALLLVVFIDAAGMGVLFPVLNEIIMAPQANFLANTVTPAQREFYYGLIIAIFFLCWFVGATYLSKTSDQIGRKRALLICLYGIFIGYGLTILAIFLKSLLLLILGRVLAGLTAGSQPVAQAAIVDISPDEQRTKNLGLIMFAFALGMVVGPVIAGVFSDTNLVSWFNNQLPFFIILMIVLVNIVLLKLSYQESCPKQDSYRFKIVQLVTQFANVFKNKVVLQLSIVFFVMQIAFNTFYVFLPVYLYQRYQYGVLLNSVAMFSLGISMAISSIIVVPMMAKRFHAKTNVIGSLLVMASALFFLLYVPYDYSPFVFGSILMLAFGVAYTSMLGLFSHSVPNSQQGWVMGITVSLFTSGAAITSLFGEQLLQISLDFPFILVVIGFCISAALLLLFPLSKKVGASQAQGITRIAGEI